MTPRECERRYETIISRKARLASAPTDRARKVRTKALRRANRKHVESMAEFLGVGERVPVVVDTQDWQYKYALIAQHPFRTPRALRSLQVFDWVALCA